MAPTFHPESGLPDLSGRVFVVTGGSQGIGYWTVFHLAKHHAKVYLCARDATRGTAAISEIKTQTPGAKVHLLLMELLDMKSVIAAAKEVLRSETALHGLINSAGIMAVPLEMTADGYESQFQTNYLAHWVLTYHLLPLLQTTAVASTTNGDVRIVNVSSMGHKSAPSAGIDFHDINLPGAFTFSRYAQSKLANVLHAKALHERFGPGSSSPSEGQKGEIWASSLHPGNVDTQLNLKSWGSWSVPLLRCFGTYVKPEEGSFTSLFAAAGKDFSAQDSGGYFVPIAQRSQASGKATPELARELWDWTLSQMTVKGFAER